MARPFALLVVVALTSVAHAQTDTSTYREMRWRGIGPFRGGRTVAATGVRQQPATFYIGVNNGGVWKTTDYGRVWSPIFDDQPTGSIGAIAVAPSDPNIIYAGSGEGLQRPDLSIGDGIYKSTDAGRHWQHLGLRDGQQIPTIVVDPRDPTRLFVAVMGHPYGPNPERGIYRSTDGGQSFRCVLCPDENTGGMDVALAPDDPNTVYAVLWSARQAPWEVGSSWTRSTSNGFYKSTDGGTTWRQITRGLPGPEQGLGRIGIGVSASDPKRVYAVVGAQPAAAGLYRSDDAGESWRRMNGDDRLWGRDGDFNEVRADPRNADVVYIANVVAWKSTDGGQTFTGWRGAPGGDDYHRLWINPDDSRVILLAGDQGAIVTVNGGDTWSSWYNQPTAQMYHVAADNAFPYRLCGGQQESGSACVSSRGDDGIITMREWHPAGLEEYGYAAPDPLDPDIVYGGKLTRFDWRSHDVQNIAPRVARDSLYRVVRTMPVVFSQADPHVLFYSSNVVWRTSDGGRSWTRISDDLTRPRTDAPANLGVFTPLDPERGAHRGVVYTLAPSPKDIRRLWAGTDDGLIHVTSDGGTTWRDVTPPELRARPWSKISILEASHFDTATAYAAVNTLRLDDIRPHIWRTRDGGRTWREIVNGIPNEGIVNVVREDPARRGLLYAGTERQVFVSFDDGDHWQSLRLNMPATSIRDLIVKDADIAVATHGRGFWILDDVEPVRQTAGLRAAMSSGTPYLVSPPDAVRWRWNKNTDTPIPPDEPQADNPPEGAILDYYLPRDARRVTLEIRSATGELIRRYTSSDSLEQPIAGRNIPDYWIRPPKAFAASAGLHRFAWDFRYATPPVPNREYPIAAVAHNTPQEPRGVWALPGRYTVRLIVEGDGGAAVTRDAPLTLRMDPRVRTPQAGLVRQHTLGRQLDAALVRNAQALRGIRALRAQLRDLRTNAGTSAPYLSAVDSLESKGAGLVGDNSGLGPAGIARGGPDNLVRLQGQLTSLLDLVQGTDAVPTTQVEAAVRETLVALDKALASWQSLRSSQLEALNARLRAANVKPIVPEP